MKEFNFSLIIASIGKKSLTSVLDCIKNSTVHPNEVIICVPEQSHFEYNDDFVKTDNIKFELKIIKINKKSQTAQRLEAYRNIKNKFFMQMDDDVKFDSYFFEKMIASYIKLTKKNIAQNICLAPLYRYAKDNKPVHTYGFDFKNNTQKLIYNLYFLIFHAMPFGNKKLGKVSCNSIPFGVCFSSKKIDFVATDWLPGGCILMNKECFIDYDHFPLEGKAYTEDIISSYLKIKEKKAKHFVDTNTNIFIENYDKFADDKLSLIKNLFREFKSRLLYVKVIKGSYLYFFIWYFLYISIKVLKHVRWRNL
jgi:hypothetical protein